MPQFPKTINGKIDRQALPDPSCGEAVRSAGHVPPGNDVERALCQIWSKVLGLPEIGVDDSFISLGGDSLLAVRAIAEIQQQLKFRVSTRDFFFLDTVSLLAGLVQGEGVTRRVPPPAPAFINRGGRQLYTLLQKPPPDKDNGRGLLLIPPLGNEQRRTQRPMRSLMQNFSRLGYTLLRFDWTGTGNSSADAESLDDLQAWLDDIHDAAGLLTTQATSIDIVAFRTGALLAAGTNLDEWPINVRYYWDPVLSGEQWLAQMQTLQQGICKDTFRFLFPRRPGKQGNGIHEFAGLRMNEKLHEALASQSLAASLLGGTDTEHTQLLVASDCAQDERLQPLRTAGVDMQVLDETNDWLDPRATTLDMIVTRGARVLGDRLIRRVPASPEADRRVG
ncbi:phosphopantetheine-binding protein [Granulosicoccus sp. 3-233]|uniref:phosphopantetheine-binding protein n=1 Tax=Granulosicoccus sp. 3-233 TaxID=3417969 RepID=UPI003D358928